MRVPGRAAVPALGEHRSGKLDQQKDDGEHGAGLDREIDQYLHHPADLCDGDGRDIGEADVPPRRILPGRAQPLEDHGDAHDDVAQHHDGIVEMLAMLDRSEHARQADGQHQHADHLHHGDQAVDPVVRVIGRGEPGEIDPGPADGEAGKAEAEQPHRIVARRQGMRQLRGGKAESSDEGQVEEQLQRRGDAMLLMRIAAEASRRG